MGTVVIILLVLIILIVAILILSGSSQRADAREFEKHRKESAKLAKQEMKDRNKEVRKNKNEYVDIFKKENISLDMQDDKQEDIDVNEGIGNGDSNQLDIEDTIVLPLDDYEEKAEENMKENDGLISHENDIEEKTDSEVAKNGEADIEFFFDEPVDVKTESKKEDMLKNSGNEEDEEKTESVDEKAEPIEGIEFFFEDNLDQYMKEAQSNDIGYLNGDEPKEKEEIKSNNVDKSDDKEKKKTTKTSTKKTTTKKATTKKTATKTTSTKKKSSTTSKTTKSKGNSATKKVDKKSK